MTQSMQLTILGSSGQQTIEWPILESRPKAIRVATPGGEIWLPRWRFAIRRYDVGGINQLLQLLAEITGNRSDALIRVWKSGHGPTEKSHRFKVELLRRVAQYREETSERRRRSFLLPLSQIVADGRKFMAPRWLFQDKLAEDEMIPRGIWPGLRAIREQIDTAVQPIGALALEQAPYQAPLLEGLAKEKREETAHLP